MATFVWIYICKRFCSCKLFACCSFEENKLDSCSAIRRVPGHLAFLGCSGSLKIVCQRCLFCDSGSYIIYWFLFTLHLENVPSFGDSGSSYILTVLSFAIPLRHISTTRYLLSRFPSTVYLKHAPSFGDPGPWHIVNTAPLSRFRFIMYLQHVPSFADSVHHLS